MLQALDHVGEQQRGCAEDEHRHGVLGPAHLLGGVDAGDAVEQALARQEHGIEKGSAAFEDRGHVGAHGLCEQQDRGQEEGYL